MKNSSGTIYSASYDADGDMTSRNGSPITWTVDNLPASLGAADGSSTFSYDPDGNRYYQAARFNNVTTDTTYIGGLFEVVSTSTTTEYRHNIMADGQIVAVHTMDQSGNAYTDYLHSDHLGSVDDVQGSTSAAGGRKPGAAFDAFGVRRDAANWDYDLSQSQIQLLKNYTDRGYTFQEQLDNVALVDMNGRVYDPSIGRFISADPIVPDWQKGQAFNRYSYVFNDPLSFFDPTGYDPSQDLAVDATIGMTAGSVIGAAAGYAVGSYGGALLGGLAGSLGDLLGPEVGVPAAIVGTVAGQKRGGVYGMRIGSIIGAAIGRKIGEEYYDHHNPSPQSPKGPAPTTRPSGGGGENGPNLNPGPSEQQQLDQLCQQVACINGDNLTLYGCSGSDSTGNCFACDSELNCYPEPAGGPPWVFQIKTPDFSFGSGDLFGLGVEVTGGANGGFGFSSYTSGGGVPSLPFSVGTLLEIQ